jgi:hypothetical protein
MKTKHLLILLLLIANTVFGQNAPNLIAIEDKEFNNYFLNKDNIPKVKGKIINLTEDEISKIKIDYTIVTHFNTLQSGNSCSLNADGSFELKLDYAFPYQQIWINIDSLFYTGVYAKTDLFIELDASILKTQNYLSYNGPGVKYLGSDGPLNEFTNNHALYKQEEQLEISSQLQNNMPLALTNYDAFIEKYDSLYSVLNELDNEFINQNPSDFSWILINERQSNYFYKLCSVHWGKQMSPELFEKIKAHKPYAISNDGMFFYNYLFRYLDLISLKKRGANNAPLKPAEGILQTTNLLDSIFEPAKADIFKIRFSSKDPQQYKQTIESVLPYIHTTWCKNVITDEYNKTIEKLTVINKILNDSIPVVSQHQLGAPIAELSFGAKLYKVDSIKADSLLLAIKNSFKDKAIFIDFWATWCAPCIGEFPHSKKMSDSCTDLPIEFVYLCTSDGSNLELWKSKIAEYQLRGTHLFVEKSIESTLMELFSASGYPSYIFIDTKGVYRPGLGKRPSALDRKKLIELINQE